MNRPGERSFPYPLGVSFGDGGVNVALYSGVAEQVYLSTFDAGGAEARHQLPMVDSDIWHGFIPGIGPGQEYGFRVSGPYSPAAGTRCNPAKLLLDPYGRSVAGNLAWRPSWSGAAAGQDDAPDPADSGPDAPRSVVVRSTFDWGGDTPPGRARGWRSSGMSCSITPPRATSTDRRCACGASTMPPTTSSSPASRSSTTT